VASVTKTLLLPPILTVIANPRNTWLRIEIALLVAADERGIEAQLGQLGDDMLSYLRTIEVSQIEGPSGLRFLKDDLLERAKTRTNGQVQDVVISALVLE
jgi:flagellar protein FliL